MKIFTLPDPNPLTGKWSDRDLVAIDNEPNGHGAAISLNTFVRVADGEREFLAQQTGLTAQCWRQYDVTDKMTVEVLRQSKIDSRRTSSITEDRVNFHPLRLAGEIVDRDLHMVRVRPMPGANVEPMPASEVSDLLKLPSGDDAFTIGSANDLALAVNHRVITHHILIAGATGSGKTNLNFQLLKGATAMGACAVAFDHKPDYSTAGDREGNVRLVLGHGGEALPGERPVSIPASSLDPALLAHTLFHRNGEHNQADCCIAALEIFSEEKKAQGIDVWALADFAEWLGDDGTKNRLIKGEELNKQSLSATIRKIKSKGGRVPPFVDAHRNKLTGVVEETFRFSDIMVPGRITVIRLSEAVQDSRGYALFIDYFMRKHAEYRHAEAGARQFLMCIVDEAQDIFSGTKEFRAAAEHTLQKAIRKGRSLNTGIVIAPQSASAIPEQIMNNLNTRFVFRHNDADEAKTALIQATDEQRKLTEELQPGECLASIFGTRMVFEFKVDEIEAGWRMPA